MNTESARLVVVGVNDSPAARRAVDEAAREAWLYRCRLELVHAFNWASKPEPAALGQALLRRAIADARRVAPGVPVQAQSPEGSALTALLRKSRTAAMTVIGDGDLLTRICLAPDALTVQVAARAADTVLVTRAAAAPAGPVVVGVNGSAASARALEFAFDAAARRQASLVVVQARESRDDDSAMPGLAERTASLKHAYRVDAQLRIVEGSPDTVLRDASQIAGLVVVGARGRHPYAGLLGWVAQTVLHHSPAPVVLVRGLMPGSGQDRVALAGAA